MAWASRWSVALRAFYKQILSSSNCKDFFFKWHRPPRKLAKEVFVKFIPAKEKTRFAKEWRKVLAKDHVIRIDSHEVFNTAQVGDSQRTKPEETQNLENLVYHFFRQLWLVLGVKLMEINSNLFSRKIKKAVVSNGMMYI